MKTRIHSLWPSLLAAALLFSSSVSLAVIKATINKNTFSQSETIQLTLHGDSQTPFQRMDLSELSNDFEIIHRSSEKRVSISNGQTQETVKLNLLMRTNQHGRLMIPSLKVGNEQTAAIQIQVNKANTQGAISAEEQPITLDMQWLTKGPAYVQAQMTLKLKIRHDGSLQQGQLDSPNIENAMVNTLGADTSYQESINGKAWQVIERHFAVTPLKSGQLTVPPLRFQGQITRRSNSNRTTSSFFEPFFGQPITLQTSTLTRSILPPASAFTGSNWLPAKSVKLSMLELQNNQFSVGDPINLNISVDAVGLLAEQLPGIQMDALPDDISVYPDDPTLSNRSDQNNVMGKLSLDIVLIPTQAGEVKLPAVEIDWWNTASDQQETARLKLPTFFVTGASAPSSDSLLKFDVPQNFEPEINTNDNDVSVLNATKSDANQTNPAWKWIALAALSGWLFTTIMLLRREPNNSQAAPINPAEQAESRQTLLAQIKQHAFANNAIETYQAIQTLDRHISKTSKQAHDSLQGQLTRLGLHQANEQIDKLKQHLFAATNQPWDSKTGWPVLVKGIEKLVNDKQTSHQDTTLRPLYPS
ncbi:MAG: hypothetical protein ACI9J2_000572 [Saprospiraceae bacterium]|jgi:hypothetical protein